MLGKKLINAGPVGSSGPTPSNYFNTVLYTGNGGTQRIGGYINRGAVFNGSTSRIDLGKIDVFTGDISVSAWVSLGNTTTTNVLRIISLNAVQSGWAGTLEVRYRPSDGLFQIGIGNGQSGETAVLNHTYSLTQGAWYHIGVTRDDSTNVTKLYINGSEEDSETVSATATVQSNAISVIGNQAQNYSPTTWNGKIDQVRLFDKALSSGEVTTLSNETHASTTISTTDIFNDNSGVALYQLDGNANDTGTTGPNGKFGNYAANFNGTSSYINTNGSPINGKTSISIAFWIKPRDVSSDQYITTFVNSDGGWNGVGIRVSSAGKINVVRANSGTVTASENSTHTLVTETWAHVAVTSTQSQLKIYINGSLDSTHSIAGFTTNNTGEYNLGALKNAGAYSQHYYGLLQEVYVYGDILTATEVDHIYDNTTASIPTSDLITHYKLDRDETDEQGNYNGTPFNVNYSTTYDGTATNVTYQEATNFSPDLVWIKGRNYSDSHALVDSVRGVNKLLFSNSTSQQGSYSNTLTSFDNNGFTLGADATQLVNYNTKTYAAWCFNAGGAADTYNIDGTGYATLSAAGLDGGSIVSSDYVGASINTAAGFGIYKYISDGAATVTTFSHGLPDTPKLIITKALDNSGYIWGVYSEATGNKRYLRLDTTDAQSNLTTYDHFNSDTSVIGIRQGGFAINNENCICYAFCDIDGFQKVGSYTGNGSANGTIVETEFEPAFVMIKRTDGTAGNWFVFDNKRSAVNERDDFLHPNSSAAETTNSAAYSVDFLSNGFQIKGNGDQINGNNGTHIYLAIAADPDTTTPTVENSFDVVTYSGVSSGTIDVDLDFKPDLLLIKPRNYNYSWNWFDSIRGDGFRLVSNTASAQSSDLTWAKLTETGFQESATRSAESGVNYVSYAWKAGDHDDSLPQINTEGTIDSVVSVNDAAGFSIVKYTGNGGSGQSVGTGMSAAPEMVIFKRTDAAQNWFVFVKVGGVYKRFEGLNTTAASTSVSSFSASSTTITWSGTTADFNGSGREYIMYCFTSITGYQKVGSYTGNGGTLNVTTGFEPRFVMLKPSSLADNWMIYDNQRGKDIVLFPNLSNGDTTYAGRFSFLSNGFQLSTSNSGWNGNGSTYIYLAIA